MHGFPKTLNPINFYPIRFLQTESEIRERCYYQVRFHLAGWRKVCVGVCYLSLLAGIVIAVEPAGCCVNPNENIQRKSPLCLFWEIAVFVFPSLYSCIY